MLSPTSIKPLVPHKLEATKFKQANPSSYTTWLNVEIDTKETATLLGHITATQSLHLSKFFHSLG